MRRIIALISGVLLIGQLTVGVGSTVPKQKNQLESLGQTISSLQNSLFHSRSQRSQIEGQLQAVETSIGSSSKQYQSTITDLGQEQQALTQIETVRANSMQQLQQQQALLAQQVQAEYMLGRQQYLKILLNQEDPARIGRYIVYYHYLTQAREATIRKIQATLKQVTQTTERINQQTQHLEVIKTKQQQVQQQLSDEKLQRAKVLQQINASIGDKQLQLQKLLHDKQRLQKVITTLQKGKYYYSAGSDFSTAKGKLPWPIQRGRILQNFAEPLAGGRLRSEGLLIAAPLGTPIHAIYSGKVVFAHWLRGYGLMVIIQHSGVYMTLYAHAESLYVKNGDSVAPGQVVATVGNSGGLTESALYFEITQYGQGVSPARWLRSRG